MEMGIVAGGQHSRNSASSITNPVTGASYRLVLNGPAWRITKTFRDPNGDLVAMRHLRGLEVSGEVSDLELDHLVRGVKQDTTNPVGGEPWRTMARVVLMDWERTSTLLLALVRDEQQRCADGVPGFRPGCASLRQRVREVEDRVTAQHHGLAEAWVSSGLGSHIEAVHWPDWLLAAIHDKR